jgi:hypothetical protein
MARDLASFDRESIFGLGERLLETTVFIPISYIHLLIEICF